MNLKINKEIMILNYELNWITLINFIKIAHQIWVLKIPSHHHHIFTLLQLSMLINDLYAQALLPKFHIEHKIKFCKSEASVSYCTLINKPCDERNTYRLYKITIKNRNIICRLKCEKKNDFYNFQDLIEK